MIISRPSEFSINVLLIFDKHNLNVNGTLILKIESFSALSSVFVSAAKRSIVSFTTINASL